MSPLAHTLDTFVRQIAINGKRIGETTISLYTAMMYNVPVAYVLGDNGAVQEAAELNPNIVGTVTKDGVGASVTAINPNAVLRKIPEDLARAVKIFKENKNSLMVKLPEHFDLDITYVKHTNAYRASFFPGATLSKDGFTLSFSVDTFAQILVILNYCVNSISAEY